MKKPSNELSPNEVKIMDKICTTVSAADTKTPIQKVLNPVHIQGNYRRKLQ